MIQKILLLVTVFFIGLTLTSCSDNQKEQKELTLATNSWIGYSPLFYAYKKKYLQKINIKLLTTVSLAEAAELYSVAKADLVTTTQHEYKTLQNEGVSIIPVILIDRSYGGDMILSNRSIQELKSAKSIKVYLEMDSINSDILEDFIRINHLDKKKFHPVNKDQAQIEDMAYEKEDAVVIVTYLPYNLSLQKRGYKIIASTKSIDSIVVIDAIATSQAVRQKYTQRLKALKKVIDRSISEIQSNPKDAFVLVKDYLGDISYNDFLKGLQTIKWINNPSEKLLKRIEPMGYKESFLIR